MNVFVLINLSNIKSSAVTTFLNSCPEVRNWYQTSNLFALVTTTSLIETRDLLNKLFQGQMFLVLQTSVGERGSAAGYMPPDFWDFVIYPKDSGYWDTKLKEIANKMS